MKKYLSLIAVAMVAIVVTACGGSGGGGSSSDNNDVIVPSSPVTINFPSDGENVLVPGDEVTFTVSLNGTQQVQSSNSKSLTSVTSAPVELALTNANSNAYSFSESSFTLTQSNPTKTVTLTILPTALPSQFGNTQLVANVNGYQTSTPIALQIVNTGTIVFSSTDLAMSTESTANIVLKVAGTTGINAVVNLVAQDGITLSTAQCTFIPSVSTCPITITSSTASGNFQVTASSTNGLEIAPLTVTVQQSNSIKFIPSTDVNLVVSNGKGTLNTKVVALYGNNLSVATNAHLTVTPSTGLDLTNGSGSKMQSCHFGVGSPDSCLITLIATSTESGDYTVSATAAGYETQHLRVHVDKAGTIQFEPNSVDMFVGEGYQARVSFAPGSSTSYVIPVTLHSNDANVTVDTGESNPTVCTISTSVGDGKSCYFTIKGNAATATGISATEPAATHIDPMTVVVRKFVKVVSNGATNCALDNNGQAYCWGYNGMGAVGANLKESNVSTPHKVSQAESGLVFKDILMARNTVCALDVSGQAYCWGDNEYGQVGMGSNLKISYYVPTKVITSTFTISGEKFVSLSLNAGNDTICGLTQYNTYCWGNNKNSVVNNLGSSSVATPSAKGIKFESVIMSNSNGKNACGLTSNGQAYCWGDNTYGQVGNGQVSFTVAAPSAVNGGLKFKQLALALDSVCGLNESSEVYCWGSNSTGQLGINESNTSVYKMVPTKVYSNFKYKSLSATLGNYCGLRIAQQGINDATPECWGDNRYGQNGNGTTVNTIKPTAVNDVELPGGVTLEYSAIFTTNASNICGIGTNGLSYCWGRGTSGQLGNGEYNNWSTPRKVLTTKLFATLVPTNSTCGLTTDEKLLCWGDGTYGQIGNGELANVNEPTAILVPNATPALLSSAQLLQTYAHVN